MLSAGPPGCLCRDGGRTAGIEAKSSASSLLITSAVAPEENLYWSVWCVGPTRTEGSLEYVYLLEMGAMKGLVARGCGMSSGGKAVSVSSANARILDRLAGNRMLGFYARLLSRLCPWEMRNCEAGD